MGSCQRPTVNSTCADGWSLITGFCAWSNPTGGVLRGGFGIVRAANSHLMSSPKAGTIERMTRILVIDDDRLMRRSVSLSLTDAGYATESAASGEEGLALARKLRPDLVLLDIGLPGMDGLETLRAFQREIAAPVIFVTARRRELDEIVGLEMGADDYITKPFDMDILLARVKAVLRRAQHSQPVSPPSQPIVVGDLRIDPAAHQVTVDGALVELAPREYDLLYYLAQRAGEAVSLDDILANVWGDEWAGETQTVYVHVRWLRTKIETEPNKPRRLLTVRGVGYRLVLAA